MDMENVMNVLLDKTFDEDSETYLIIIEAEEYWNSPRVSSFVSSSAASLLSWSSLHSSFLAS